MCEVPTGLCGGVTVFSTPVSILAFIGEPARRKGSFKGEGDLGISTWLSFGEGHLGSSGLIIFTSGTETMGVSFFTTALPGGDAMDWHMGSSFFSGVTQPSKPPKGSLGSEERRLLGDSLGAFNFFVGVKLLSLSDSPFSPSVSFLRRPFFLNLSPSGWSSGHTIPMLFLVLVSFLARISPMSNGSGSLNS